MYRMQYFHAVCFSLYAAVPHTPYQGAVPAGGSALRPLGRETCNGCTARTIIPVCHLVMLAVMHCGVVEIIVEMSFF